MKKIYEKPEIRVLSVKSEENITDETASISSTLTYSSVQTANYFGKISYGNLKSY
ncbi:MAG: hypothetical protein LUC92_04940 [Clostridiales bacterium]|nr:hypothetical protein [Clostridiales bacterium]